MFGLPDVIRLISLMDVSLALAKLPAGCRALGALGAWSRSLAKIGFTDFDAKGHATVVLDCCHSTLPGLGV